MNCTLLLRSLCLPRLRLGDIVLVRGRAGWNLPVSPLMAHGQRTITTNTAPARVREWGQSPLPAESFFSDYEAITCAFRTVIMEAMEDVRQANPITHLWCSLAFFSGIHSCSGTLCLAYRMHRMISGHGQLLRPLILFTPLGTLSNYLMPHWMQPSSMATVRRPVFCKTSSWS